MSDTKIILSELRLFSGKENEITGVISYQENQLFWNDKRFIFSDQVIDKLESLQVLDKLKETTQNKKSKSRNFKLTIIENDKERYVSEWKLDEEKETKQNKKEILPLTHGDYKEKEEGEEGKEGEKITFLLSLASGQEWSFNKDDLKKIDHFKYALKKFHLFLFEAEICLQESYKRFNQDQDTQSYQEKDFRESLIGSSCRDSAVLLIAKVYDKSKSAISLDCLTKILCENYQNWKQKGDIDSLHSIDQVHSYCENITKKISKWEEPLENLDLLRKTRDKTLCHIDIEEMFKYQILNSRTNHNNFNDPLSTSKLAEKKNLEELITDGNEICENYANFIGLKLPKYLDELKNLDKLKALEED